MATVDPALVRLIAQVESNSNPHAQRFERRIFNKITNNGSTRIQQNIKSINKCSDDTARIIYSTSYGAYQIMGFNLYGELNLATPIIEFLNDPPKQIDIFVAFLELKDINYSWNAMSIDDNLRDKFARTYNGSVLYGDKMKSTAKILGI